MTNDSYLSIPKNSKMEKYPHTDNGLEKDNRSRLKQSLRLKFRKEIMEQITSTLSTRVKVKGI